MKVPPIPEGFEVVAEPPLRSVDRGVDRGRPTENRGLAGFTPVVTEQGRKRHPVDQIDPRLYEIMAMAAKDSPYEVRFDSGYRQGDKRQHGKHNALDVELWDRRTGKKLSDYQDPEHFREYEQFAQTARRVQQQLYPELDGAFRWGGYFSGKKNYGAMDLMHFDIGGGKGLGMLGGSWDGGLTDKQRSLWKGVVSQGMGGQQRTSDSAPMGPPITQLRRDMQAYFPMPALPAGFEVVSAVPPALAKPKQVDSRSAWARDMLQYAAPAAERIGVDPAFLVAHAAQETGWGRGVHDNNYFNITGTYQGKGRPRGDTNAAGRKITQKFRMYDSPEESFSDLADLLERRYKGVRGAKDALAYGTALKAGGYAEDPGYAKHIAERYAELKKLAPGGLRTSGSTLAPTTMAANVPPIPPGFELVN